jgi:flagellar basal body-associated protein FliL
MNRESKKENRVIWALIVIVAVAIAVSLYGYFAGFG